MMSLRCRPLCLTAIVYLVPLFGSSLKAAEPIAKQTAKGVVFHDQNGNGTRDEGESGVEGVRVSNGEAVVLTGADGRYTLPVDGDTILFACKPQGWIYPVDENNLPQFFYIHKPNGSPDDDFRFKGSEPTGPLPESVDFALRPFQAPNVIRAVLLGDPQPVSIEEVQFFGRDIMSELVDVDAEFGVTLGDIVGNQLDLFQPMIEMQGLAGIPWHNVIGNHDINFRAPDDEHANETFHKAFGPSDYAFQYGDVHFLAMDNIVYHGFERKGYHAGLSKRQLAFMENYLHTVPQNHRILIGTHIPLTNGIPGEEQPTPELKRVLELLSRFPHTASFSAHTHLNAIYHLGSEFGYHSHDHGVHIHHNVGTASGTWWKGPLDSRGIPMTTMRDGTPNGYAIATFDGPKMSVKWKAANHEEDYQMNLFVADAIAADQLSSDKGEVLVNVFNGSHSSHVKMRVVGHSEWVAMKHEHRNDPHYVRQQSIDESTPMEGTKRMNRPRESTHIWVGHLPNVLPKGTHLLEVQAEDAYGETFTDRRPFRVQ
ncbi:calcineurin-like phosphoesterase family protein [Roseiconus lacunae]|uniref:calcineurin-like phosphoesterase C-terminal domain-containing protein n=1 Tax=Roseiconus lacunae TaxID=2605694 RepID=UPI00308B3C9F|nr:calcineurin-like phosphoesterase family protein [Stieleria sp. HD01]